MLADLLPLIVAAALLPAWIMVVLLLLRGEGGALRAGMLVGGAMLTRLLQGVVFGLLFGAVSSATDSIVAETLLLVVGILFLVLGVRKVVAEEDSDAPPPRWMARIGSVSPLAAFGLGAVFMLVAVKQWVFTLSAIAIIEAAAPGQPAGTLIYVGFVVGAASLLLLPVIISALAPDASARVVEAAHGWLERNSRILAIVVSLGFGVWFTWKGATGLLGQ